MARITREVPCRVDVYDPKGEIAPFLIDGTNARVFEHASASSAARSAIDSGENGILVLEEMMAVPGRDYADITEACAIRRRSTSGEGVAIFATTQRPKIMPVAIRSIADIWIVGQITDSDDLRAIASVAGGDFASELPTLEIGQFRGFTFGKSLEL